MWLLILLKGETCFSSLKQQNSSLILFCLRNGIVGHKHDLIFIIIISIKLHLFLNFSDSTV